MGSNSKDSDDGLVVMVPYALVLEMNCGDSWHLDSNAAMVDQEGATLHIDEVQKRIMDGSLRYIIIRGESHNDAGLMRPALSLIATANISTVSIVYDNMMASQNN